MRRALCVGIDLYPFGSLRGCVSDAERMSNVLARHEDGSPNFDCKTVLGPIDKDKNLVTRKRLGQEIEELFKYKADLAFFHFSGHGTANNLDGYLMTQDAEKYAEGFRMVDLLKLANESQSSEVVIMLDCCYSGQLGQMPPIDNKKAILREGVSILTASREDQPSVEVGGGGLFTSLVVDALEGGAAEITGEVTVPAVYASVEAALGAWDQRPLLKSFVSKLVPLRRCAPAIDPAILRRLPKLFSLPAEDLPLDPSFERAAGKAADPTNIAIFDELQKLNRVHLVIPVGELHMFDAAMKAKACRLTATGRYYWRLASSGRI